MSNKYRGFTLVELLIVIMIIGILATMAVPQYNKMVGKAKFSEAWMNLGAIWKADEMYYAEHGDFVPQADDNVMLDSLSISNPNYNENRKFQYYISGGWAAKPGSNKRWLATGRERLAQGGPDGECMILHFADRHIEKYINYPYQSNGWVKVE